MCQMVKTGWGVGATGAEQGKHDYLKAVENADTVLSRFFEDDDGASAGLFSERYKLIRAMDAQTPRPMPLVEGEVDRQMTVLTSLITSLEAVKQLQERTGTTVILDTNCLMHFQRLDTVPWREVLGIEEDVRIVLPVMVIDELDNKKYTGSDTMAGRASKAIKMLRAYSKDLRPGCAAALPDGNTTLEVWLDEPGHQRKTNPDAELFDRAVLLQRVLGQPVTIVSGDFGMQLRAEGHGLQQTQMPDKYAKDALRRKAAEEDGTFSGVEG
jgi:hypothetical protein